MRSNTYMADDKSKSKTQTKKALLGELESIKSLLDDSTDDIIDFDDATQNNDDDDENFDPPILTTAVEHDLDVEEDIPVLTEAFDTVIAEIESSELEVVTTEQAFEEPTFDQWPDEEDSEGDPEGNDSSLFDELAAEFEQQWSDDDADVTDEADIHSDNAAQVESDEIEIDVDIEDEFDLAALNEAENNTPSSPAPTAKSESAGKKRGTRETQPSLFDEPQSAKSEPVSVTKKTEVIETIKQATPSEPPKPVTANSSTTTSTATPTGTRSPKATAVNGLTSNAVKNVIKSSASPTASAASSLSKSTNTSSSQSLKSENPFLPKHIRDRLHTNRSLQDELTSMNSAASELNNKTAVEDSATDKHEKLVDELVDFYLPKIEEELRRRLRKRLAQQFPDDVENT